MEPDEYLQVQTEQDSGAPSSLTDDDFEGVYREEGEPDGEDFDLNAYFGGQEPGDDDAEEVDVDGPSSAPSFAGYQPSLTPVISEEERAAFEEEFTPRQLEIMEMLAERKAQNHLRGWVGANAQLYQQGQASPYLQAYGPRVQQILSEMPPERQVSQQALLEAQILELAQAAYESGSLETTLMERAQAISRGRVQGRMQGRAAAEGQGRPRLDPPAARIPAPAAGKVPARQQAAPSPAPKGRGAVRVDPKRAMARLQAEFGLDTAEVRSMWGDSSL